MSWARRWALAALCLVLFGESAQAQPALGEEIDHDRHYAACMAMARTQPEEAHESALAWRDRGGGDAAMHCIAVSLIGLGQHREAATRLERLALDRRRADPRITADLLAQAGQAWLIAGDAQRAHADQTSALKLAPNDVELLVDRAMTLASTGAYWEAVDDLDRAIELAPERPDALVFRATAYRHLEALELAADDLARALALSPHHIEGLLERGLVRRLTGNPAGARADWLRVIELAPESPAGTAARSNLERMDLKP